MKALAFHSALITGPAAVFPPAQQRGDVLLGTTGTDCESDLCCLSYAKAVQKLRRDEIQTGYSGPGLVQYLYRFHASNLYNKTFMLQYLCTLCKLN